MVKIYVARHGQNEDNAQGILNGRRDLPLTELGFRQAEELGTLIKENGISFDLIMSSPLIRAVQTAEVVSKMLGKDDNIIKLSSLIERNLGEMTGKPIADISKLCHPDDIVQARPVTYFLRAPGAETFEQVMLRGESMLKVIQQKYHYLKSILLVCHGDIGKMLYGAYYGHPWREMLTKFHLGNSEMVLLHKTSDPGDRHIVQLRQYNY